MYGGIVCGMNSGVSVSSWNNTHNGCVRVAQSANTAYHERQPNITTSTDFIDDTFTDIYGGDDVHGGALYFYSNQIVTLIQRCIFTNCSVMTTANYYGGAFYAYTKSIQTINTTITNCTARFGGGIRMDSITTCMSVRMCVIDGCKCVHIGGGIYFVSCPVGDAVCQSGSNVSGSDVGVGSGLVVECSFTECSTNTSRAYYDGGGGANWYNAPNTTLFRSCVFRQCVSSQYGGGLNIRDTSRAESPTKLVCDSFFDGNTLTHASIKNGFDVFLHRNDTKTFTENVMSNTFTTREEGNRMVCNNSGTVEDCDGWLPVTEAIETIWIDYGSKTCLSMLLIYQISFHFFSFTFQI